MIFDDIEFNPPCSQEEWDRLTPQTKLKIIDAVKLAILNSIQAIRCHIHKIEISTGSSGYSQIEEALGTLKPNERYRPGTSMYQKKSYRTCDSNKRWIVLSNPKGPQFPQGKLITVSPSICILDDCSYFLDRAKVINAEYAIDLMCSSPATVRNLFNLLKRYAHLSGLQEGSVKFYKGDANYTYRLGRLKIYERGPDKPLNYGSKGLEKKHRKYWEYSELDRVRIEFTANQKNLEDCGVRRVSEFVENPHFLEMLKTSAGKKRLDFVKFKDTTSELYPKEWMSYNSPLRVARRNGIEIRQPFGIQNEILKLRAKGEKTSTKIIEDKSFDDLHRRIEQAAAIFERFWKIQHNKCFD